MSDADALEGALVIRRVDDERQAVALRMVEHRGTAAIDERTDHPIRAARLDPTEAAKAGAPEDPSEDGFRLIVLRVADRDRAGGLRSRDLVKRGIASLTGAGLDRLGLPGNLDPGGSERNFQ